MSTFRFRTINDLVNQVASEVASLPKVSDVFAEPDPLYQQLITLANEAGYELIEERAWQGLTREVNFTTQAGDTGKYDFPDDYAFMINQTGWERSQNVPLFGPLSAQMWSYLLGRDLVSYTIYASFREVERQFWLFPQPPAEGLEISYEYCSRNWVIDSSEAPDPDPVYADSVQAPADTVLFEPILFTRLLKLRFLEARGFDTTAALARYQKSLNTWGGRDEGGPILNVGVGGWQYPYLETYRNTPDTGFGNP